MNIADLKPDITTATDQTPRQVDEQLAELSRLMGIHERDRSRTEKQIFRAAGYKTRRESWNTEPAWPAPREEMLAAARRQPHLYSPQERATCGELLEVLGNITAAIESADARISDLDAIYRLAPWSRFFPTETSSGGHIHSSQACHTLHATTVVLWRPDLSGKTVAEAVRELGPVLCQVCFPEAKAEWKREPAEWRRERDGGAKAAEKASREAKRAAKTLQPEERFEDTWGTVTTVAGAVKVLRDEVEYRDYYGHGQHPSWALTAAAAVRARRVLLDREAEHAGWGKCAVEIDQIVSRAVAKNRKEGARI